MRPRTTLALALLALLLVALVVFWEHERPGTREVAEHARRLLPPGLDASAPIRVELASPQGELVIAREGERWRLVEPLTDIASEDKVQRVVGTLDAAEVFARVPESEIAFSLGAPSTRVMLQSEGGRALIELHDASLAETYVYARVDGSPELALVSRSLPEELALSADQLREERLLLVEASEVARLEVRGPGETQLAFARGARGWRVVEPYSDVADASRVGALLDAMLALRADRFAPGAGTQRDEAAPAWLSATAHDVEGATLAGLEIGAPSAEASARRWARVAGRPGAMRVDARALARQLSHDVESWRSLLVLDFAPSELARLTYRYGERVLQFERADPDSPWVAPEEASPLDQELVEELVLRIARVEAERACVRCSAGAGSLAARLDLEGFTTEGAPTTLASLEILEDAEEPGTRLVRRGGEGPLLVVQAESLRFPAQASLTVSKQRE